MHDFMKTILSGMKEWTNKRIKSNTPNWDENNPEAEGYIKNRPFYTKETYKALVDNISIEIIDTLSVNMLPINNIVEGQIYNVIWDDTEYNCIAYIAEGPNTPSIGNGALGDASGGNNEPFFITIYEGDVLLFAEAGTHTISISTNSIEVKKIPTEYLELDLAPVATSGNYNDLINKPSAVLYTQNQNLSSTQKTAARENIDAVSTDVAIISQREGETTELTWDGNTYGRTKFYYNGWTYYKVSDVVPSYETILGNVRHMTHVLDTIPTEDTPRKGENCYCFGTSCFIAVTKAGDCALSVNPGEEDDALSFNASEVGIYFFRSTSDFRGIYLSYTTATGDMTILMPSYETNTKIPVKLNENGTFFKEHVPNGNLLNGEAEGSLRMINTIAENESYKLGNEAFAEGYKTQASGQYSHAEGGYTVASFYGSHAEGYETVSEGYASHAEGFYSKASGNNSHAEGNYTIAAGKSQHVQGEYNLEDAVNKYTHIIGNGTADNARSNAHTVDWDGNAWYQGNVYVGGTDQDTGSKKLATEEFVNAAVAGIEPPSVEGFATESYVDEAIASNKPNWNAVQGEPGYIENRTHWIGENEEVLPMVELNEEDGFMYASPLTTPIEVGQAYVVNWNGTEYKCTAKAIIVNGVSVIYLGNGAGIPELELPDTNEPFIIIENSSGLMGDECTLCATPLDGSTSVNVSIHTDGKVYHTIDGNFLPEYIYGYNKEVLYPVTTLTFEEGTHDYGFTEPLSFSLIEGDTYTVIFNGMSFESIAKSVTLDLDLGLKGLALGDINVVETGEPNGTYPFTFVEVPAEMSAVMGVYAALNCYDESLTEVSFGIYGNKVRKVPDEFLPEKTHWENKEDVELLAETTVSMAEGSSYGQFMFNKKNQLIIGETYKVVFNNEEYLCELKQAQGSFTEILTAYLGNGVFAGDTSTNEPFGIYILSDAYVQELGGIDAMVLFTDDNSTQGTFAIYEPAGTIHKLDAKFLPAGIATEEYVNEKIAGLEAPDVSGLATEEYVDTKVANLVDSSPDTLNTLNELAAALNDDPNFATTIANQIGSKVDKTTTINGKALSSNITLSATDIGALPDTTVIPSIEGLATKTGVINNEYTTFRASSTDGITYTATIDGLTSLTSGTLLVMIPSVTSASKNQIKLNINSLGAKNIYREANDSLAYGASADWLSAGIPYVILYRGSYWTVINLPKILASDLDGAVPITLGGTGATDAATARTNLGITPANIGAATTTDITNALSSYAKKTEIPSIEGLATETYVNEAIEAIPETDLGNYYTKAQTNTQINNAISTIDFPVDSVNGKTGTVSLSASDVNAVPTSRTVNGKTLNSNITLSASDVGALPNTTQIPSIEGLATETYVNNAISAINFPVKSINGKTGVVNLIASDINAEEAGAAAAAIDALYIKNGNNSSIRSAWSAEDDSEYSIGYHAIALGADSKANGDHSYAEGHSTTASGHYSHAEGHDTTASGDVSHAEGFNTTAGGIYSHAEGFDTTASGSQSHTEGRNTTASESQSHAEGHYTTASGQNSHAEGYYTTASEGQSHAEGYHTVANGEQSHAEGYYTTVSGKASHVEGYRTTASSDNQHVQGKFNLDDTTNKYAHIVGNGEHNYALSNAHTVDWNGLGWFAGGLKVGGTGQDDAAAVSVLTANDLVAITNDEIDSICGTSIAAASEVAY